MGKIYCKTIGISGFDGAIRGMRFPKQSNHLSDSKVIIGYLKNGVITNYKIGQRDLELCKKLTKGGPEHRKFNRMIHVQVEIAMPRYVWSEIDTYKIATTANSESTMHKLLNNNNEITVKQFFLGNDERVAAICLALIKDSIDELELMRKAYKGIEHNLYSNLSKIELLVLAKRILPESFIQKRMFDTDYETIRNMYHQRKTHPLKEEWQDTFCKWVEALPYFEELIA